MAAPLLRETRPVLCRGMAFMTEDERDSVDVKNECVQAQCRHWSTSRDVALSFTVGWEWDDMEAHIKKFGLLMTAKKMFQLQVWFCTGIESPTHRVLVCVFHKKKWY